MSLIKELESIESSPDYQAMPPEQRADVLRGWQSQATGDPEVDEVRAQIAGEAIAQRKSMLRAKMPVNPLTGTLREAPPTISEIVNSPDWEGIEDAETRKNVLRGWAKESAEAYNGAALTTEEAKQVYGGLMLAEKTLADEQGDVFKTEERLPDLWRADLSEMVSLAKTPVFVKGRVKYEKGSAVPSDDGKYEVNPTEALRPEKDYLAFVDSLSDASPEDKLRLKATYKYRREAAFANIVDTMTKTRFVKAAKAMPGQTSFDPGTYQDYVILQGNKIPFEEIAEVAMTPDRETNYSEKGGEQEALFSADPAVRKEAEKRTALQFARHILPAAGQASLAMTVAANPEGPEARELVERHRDYLKSTLWVNAQNIKDNPWEKARLLSDGQVAVNHNWARTIPEDIESVAAAIGAPEKAEEIRRQVNDLQLSQALYLLANGGAVDADFDPFVADMKRKGVTDPIEIMKAWDEQYGTIDNINAGLVAAVRQFQDIGTGLLGLVASANPQNQDLQQYVAYRAAASQTEAELENLLAGSKKSDLIQGIATEVPWIVGSLAGVGLPARAASGAFRASIAQGARASLTADILQATRMVSAAPNLASRKAAELMSAAQLSSQTYFGLQAGRSFGGMYTSAYNARLEEAQKAGLNAQDAQRVASVSALGPALAAGISTGVLMKLMPGGTEAGIKALSETATIGYLKKRFGAKAVSEVLGNKEFSRSVYQYLSQNIQKGGMISALGKSIGAGIVGATKEGIEEATDEAIQAYLTSDFDPRMTLQAAMEQVVTAGYLGAVIGGGMTAASNFIGNRKTAEIMRSEKSSRSPLAEQAEDLEQNGDTETADAIREVAGASPLEEIVSNMVGTKMSPETIEGVSNPSAVVSDPLDRDAADALAEEIQNQGKEVDVTVDEDPETPGKFRVRVAETATEEEVEEVKEVEEEN